MYTSRNARLYSVNFHSPRKPSVPILKDRIGGTTLDAANRDEAWRIVPSPPNVTTMSTLSRNALPLVGPSRSVYMGNGISACISSATSGSSSMFVDEYAALVWLLLISKLL